VSRDALKSAIEAKLKIAPPLGYVVDIDMGDDGHVILDGSDGVNTVLDSTTKPIDTTLGVSLGKIRAIVDGTADPNMAVLTGQMKVSGKMGVALKLAAYLE
jgi:putative sterol carrier protein